jgi:phytoene dehydrogenase-like protein
VRAFAPGDVAGWRAMSQLKRRVRDALRPAGDRDLWIGPAPSREQIEARLRGHPEARALVFEWSMVELVERYLTDERLQLAYLGQGVIGTDASPHDAGTASVWFHHGSGRMDGMPGTWGYVEGGMGMVSFLLCDAAREAGADVSWDAVGAAFTGLLEGAASPDGRAASIPSREPGAAAAAPGGGPRAAAARAAG